MLELLYSSKEDRGHLAPFIGWIDFGPELYLDLEHPTQKIENIIPGGYKISFDLTYSQSVETTIGLCYAVIPPVDQTCPFGLTEYTGLDGNVVLSIGSNKTENTIYTIKLEHILVTDKNGNVVPDFILYTANAKHTCMKQSKRADRLTLKTDHSCWSIADGISLLQGLDDLNPKVTGAGTQIVTEEGTSEFPEDTKAYIYATLAPKTIEVECYMQDGFQSVAFGIMLLSQNRECPVYLTKDNINIVKTGESYSFYYDTCGNEELVSFTFCGENYPLMEWPVFIKSKIGIYIFYKNHYFLFTEALINSDEYDLFVFNTKCRKREFVQPMLFAYLSSVNS